MAIDLTKLTPAPWFLESDDGKPVLSSNHVQRIAFAIDENHVEFIALARNAFDVMICRNWSARQFPPDGNWHAVDCYGNFPEECDNMPRDDCADPFTALVEADLWMKEQEKAK